MFGDEPRSRFRGSARTQKGIPGSDFLVLFRFAFDARHTVSLNFVSILVPAFLSCVQSVYLGHSGGGCHGACAYIFHRLHEHNFVTYGSS